MGENGELYFLCFRVRRIRTKFVAGLLVVLGVMCWEGFIPSPTNDLVRIVFVATQLDVPAPPSTDEVLRIDSEGSSTTLDLDNGKLRLTFEKNGGSKLPTEIVVDGHTLLADPGRSEIAQVEVPHESR